MTSSVVVRGVVLYAFYCSNCLTLASDHRPDHTLCVACDALESEVERRRLAAAEREVIALRLEVRALKAVIGSVETADILPEDPCAAV